MGTGRTGLTRTAAGLALAGCIAVVGVGAAVLVGRQLDTQHADRVRRAQAAVQATVDTRITRLTGRVEQYADVLRRSPSTTDRMRLLAAPRADFTAFAVARPSLPLILRAGDPAALNRLPTIVGNSEVQAAAATARDSASPIATIVGPSQERQLVVVWPLYAGRLPIDTQTRRAQSVGWVVGASAVRDVAAPVVAAAQLFGDPVHLSTDAAGPAALGPVLKDGVHLRVNSVMRDSVLPVWLIAAGTLLACTCVVALTLAGRRRERADRRRHEALERQARLVSDLSGTVQDSLDVGVLLPAALALISEEFGLASVRVLAGSGEDPIEVLGVGRRVNTVPTQRWSPDTGTAQAGQLVRLPMRRANRTLGRLEAVPATDLDVPALASLRQAADLLAGALYNSDLYEREQESVRRLRELDELKDDFLSTVSHELRTPLSVLVGSVTLLTEGWGRLPEEGRHTLVTQMKPHVTSLTHLVNDLLDFISERRTTNATLETLSLDGEVRQLGEQLRPLCNKQELRVHAGDDVQAWTDARALERIIGNLVANAAKYSPPDTVIDLTVQSGPEATISISDQGPGIRPEDRERIFERFYRGDSDASRSTRGSGIGLAVTLAWVRAIGARLDVTTVVGQGTTVEVHLPMSPNQPLDGAGTVNWLDAERDAQEVAR